MKKALFALLILGGSAATFTSCNKVVDKIKANINPFNETIEVNYTISQIAQGATYNSQDQTYDFNINEIIEENVSGVNVGIDDISEIKINKITLTLQNGDDANNWTNLESATATINTDKGKNAGKVDLTSTVNIDDNDAEKFSDKVLTFSDHNLKEYVDGSGTKVIYKLSAKARKAVSKELNIVAKIEYSFKP